MSGLGYRRERAQGTYPGVRAASWRRGLSPSLSGGDQLLADFPIAAIGGWFEWQDVKCGEKKVNAVGEFSGTRFRGAGAKLGRNDDAGAEGVLAVLTHYGPVPFELDVAGNAQRLAAAIAEQADAPFELDLIADSSSAASVKASALAKRRSALGLNGAGSYGRSR